MRVKWKLFFISRMKFTIWRRDQLFPLFQVLLQHSNLTNQTVVQSEDMFPWRLTATAELQGHQI